MCTVPTGSPSGLQVRRVASSDPLTQKPWTLFQLTLKTSPVWPESVWERPLGGRPSAVCGPPVASAKSHSLIVRSAEQVANCSQICRI